ncbi:MAG: hypothetical protein H6712_08780 [Myxococcales bacterium]|nr:hypothetical protein [Myxococcales bacterium]MCB9713934.1 hypothetical protein [Myxococcales bacterium]
MPSSDELPAPSAIDALLRFLAERPDFDLLDVALTDPESIPAWPGLDIELLRAGQRLLRLVPDHDLDRAIALLRAGARSAIELADMPLPRFAERYGHALGDDRPLIERVHGRARAIRTHVHLLYVASRQSAEPHLPRALSTRRS